MSDLMAQQTARTSYARSPYQPASAGDDLDALLDSIMGEDPGPRQERTGGSARDVMRRRLEQQREDERHVSEEAVIEELRAQLRALARQVQALNEANVQHTANARAINELRQGVRELLAATNTNNQQPKLAAPATAVAADVQHPSFKVKLVMAQAANLVQQSDRDVSILSSWAMLFGGIGVGAFLSIILDLAGLQAFQLWIFVAIACFAVVVAVVFTFLALQANRRTRSARKDMEDTAQTRSVPMN